jgi:HTH-type transcriptional regulator / antitoxin HigA
MEKRVKATNDLAGLVRAWQGIRAKAPELGPIRTERAYARMNELMEAMLEVVGDDEDHELADLLDIVSTLVAQYEDTHHPELPPVEPREVLRFLMEQHDLKQADLAKDLGSQGIVSEILAGRRDLNTRQVKALAKRFSVSPAVFIG